MFFSPTEMMRLTIKTGMMMTEAQMALGLRLLGLGTLWTPPTRPLDDPLTEKLTAPDPTVTPRRTTRKKSNVTPLADKASSQKA